MANCDFIEICPFLNEKTIEMPITTQNLVDQYCYGDFSRCSIHNVAMTLGIDKVPKYLYPNDKYELSQSIKDLILWGRLGW